MERISGDWKSPLTEFGCSDRTCGAEGNVGLSAGIIRPGLDKMPTVDRRARARKRDAFRSTRPGQTAILLERHGESVDTNRPGAAAAASGFSFDPQSMGQFPQGRFRIDKENHRWWLSGGPIG